MLQNDNKERYIKILQKILDNNSIGFETKLQETALDSLKYISLVVEVEKEFDMKFDDENLLLHNFETVEDLFEYVNEKSS
jgi:acyl carrier protein